MTIKKGFVKFTRVLEPLKLRLRIWFLREEEFLPDSIKETFMFGEGISLKKDVMDSLASLFVETDRELKYGINKQFLRNLFSKINCLKTKEEVKAFYDDSIYQREVRKNIVDLLKRIDK